MSRSLFPKISVSRQQWLKVADDHQIYVEESGSVKGIPVLYIHGGPGSGSSEHYRRYFDPEKYRIITFDQRGCGRSKPSPSIKNNTTELLVSDIEAIREQLNISKWLITGGSWGTTLALLYGIKYSKRVLGFILRGIFLATQEEFDWLYGSAGACAFFPEYYREFIEHLPIEQRENLIEGYQQQTSSINEVAAIAASKSWFLWELRLSSLSQQHIDKSSITDPHQAHCMALISSYYFSQNAFIEENYILNNIDKICAIPAVIIHGRYDMVCQLKVADKLYRAWNNAQLQIMPNAGHSGFEPQTIDAFCKATDKMADFLNETSL